MSFKTNDFEKFSKLYFTSSVGTFTMVNDSDEMQELVDQVRSTYNVKMDENSPYSTSMYFLTNDTLIRVANHWGQCGFMYMDSRLY